ncbi:DUF3237 domain-containing protein [Microbacterium azadirachtae]|uniref:DUF3237 domain-containing protein n=1 Tax=Microbacterium azadirachtae TaxID=582680 RepID=UPI003F74AE85
MTDAPEPSFEFAFDLDVDIDEGWHIGRGEDEKLWFTPITGGRAEGPMLSATVVPGGGDWSTKRRETTEVEARYLLRADDGAMIDVVNRGYFRAAPDIERRLDSGEPVPDGSYYFRTAFTFRTDAPQHRWMTESQMFGIARDEGGQIRIGVYRLT